jgi:hypothetical protein
LKLVTPSAQPPQSSGGAPSFSTGAASRAAEAPFALSDSETAMAEGGRTVFANADGFGSPRSFVEEARAGEDRIGQPVSFIPSSGGAAPAQAFDRGRDEPLDSAGRIKRGLEDRGKPLLAVALEGAKRVGVEGDEVRVEFTPEAKHLYDTLRKAENQKLLREVCCDVLGRGVGVSVQMKTPGDAGDEALNAEDEARREQRLMRERAESNPVVQKMLKTFRAEIVEVRRTDNAQQ